MISISIRNFLVIGVLAMIFFIITKTLVNKYPVLEPIKKPVLSS